MRRSASYIVLVIGFALCLSGCRPKGILHSWEMKDLLVDLHKTEAMLQVSGLNKGHSEAKDIYYAMTLAKHGVTQAQFDSSLVWYTEHPQLFDKIYPKVLKQITAERTAFEAAHQDELTVRIRGGKKKDKEKEPPTPSLTKEQLDSILNVSLHGYPSVWDALGR